ncbi:MAG: M20/M25/M40 family metallo-hydrolase [Myxococcota bacterium]
MMKPYSAVVLSVVAACSSSDGVTAGDVESAALAIAPERLKAHIDTLAADGMGGRICGSPGHDAARDYVRDQLAAAGVEPFGDDGSFVFSYAATPFASHYQRQADGSIVPNATDRCQDLVGILRGSERPDEYVVLVAHYDHLGVTSDGTVFNGAFDDGSGTAGLLEVARALVAEGVRPKRSIVFLVSDQEEQGLVGAKEWLDRPPMPLDKIVVGIAADPLGRGLLPDFAPIVLSGAEQAPALSTFLRATRDLSDHPLGFIHRMMIPVFGSDHDQFFAHGVPAVWLVSPGMSFYHTVDDDAATIDYAVLRDVSRYWLRLAMRIADGDERFTYEGAAELDLQHAQDTKDLLVGVTGSQSITAEERTQVQGYIADLDRVLASDWSAIDSPITFFVDALGFVAFTLPRLHPGPIPPAFPAAATP